MLDHSGPIEEAQQPVGVLNADVLSIDDLKRRDGLRGKKATCLWLYNLPRLVPTHVVEPAGKWVDAGQKTGKRRGRHRSTKDRSRTFPGIAAAMADQWGSLP